MDELRATVDRTASDLAAIGTPIDQRSVIDVPCPWRRVLYELDEVDKNVLPEAVARAVSGSEPRP